MRRIGGGCGDGGRQAHAQARRVASASDDGLRALLLPNFYVSNSARARSVRAHVRTRALDSWVHMQSCNHAYACALAGAGTWTDVCTLLHMCACTCVCMFVRACGLGCAHAVRKSCKHLCMRGDHEESSKEQLKLRPVRTGKA
eukprot:6177663-Pleurochrysis_carterae.AAC.1